MKKGRGNRIYNICLPDILHPSVECAWNYKGWNNKNKGVVKKVYDWDHDIATFGKRGLMKEYIDQLLPDKKV